MKALPRPEAATWQEGLDRFDDEKWYVKNAAGAQEVEAYRPCCHIYVNIDPLRQIYMELGCDFIGGVCADGDWPDE